MRKTHHSITVSSLPALLLLVAVSTAGMLTACGPGAPSAAATFDFAPVDAFATQIYEQLVESLHSTSYLGKVDTGFSVAPAKYETVLAADIGDGTYKLGTNVYKNVLGAAHAPRIQSNLVQLGKVYKNMGALFKDNLLSTASELNSADVRQYFRFTAAFLAEGGFANETNDVYKQWGFANLANIARTGIFISQLEAVEGLTTPAAFDLDGGAGGNNVGGAAAANGMSSFSATNYANGANSCAAYKDAGVSAKSNCISPAEGSSLWPQACTSQSGGDPDCSSGNSNCGKQVTLSNSIGGGHSITATICGACPKAHPENIQNAQTYAGSGNACGAANNIDMTDAVYNGLGYSGSTQRQTTDNPGTITTATPQ